MFTILMILLVLMLLGALPVYPHSRSWGYGPSGGLGTIVVILVVLLLFHVISAEEGAAPALRFRRRARPSRPGTPAPS